MKTTNAKLLYYDKYVDCTYPTWILYYHIPIDYFNQNQIFNNNKIKK